MATDVKKAHEVGDASQPEPWLGEVGESPLMGI